MIATLKAGVRRAHALCNEVARHTQAFVREVAVNGEAGLLPKHTHHIIFAEVKVSASASMLTSSVRCVLRYSRMAAVFSLQCSDGA